MEKFEELSRWKAHILQLTPIIKKQLDWMEEGEVQATIKADCPEYLLPVAKNLVEIQNANGEYQRNLISKPDVEKIKYYSKNHRLGFDEVVNLMVENSRYMSKDAIEARGVAGYILEIESVYNRYYKQHGVFPINAMSADVKRACRNFKTDVTISDKIEAIIEVFMPELDGLNIVSQDYSVVPQSKYELTKEDVDGLGKYFKSMADEAGNIDKCFDADNQESFLEKCRLLYRARVRLNDFLKLMGLTYTKCYSAEAVPAVTCMINSYKEKFGTTKGITYKDPYLRNKIEFVQALTRKYSMIEVNKVLGIKGDNEDGKNNLDEFDIAVRRDKLLTKLENLYPTKIINKYFIVNYPGLYDELKFLTNRLGFNNMNEFLANYGFVRESFHVTNPENLISLSERDLKWYDFQYLSSDEIEKCNFKELDPVRFFGIYNKLISIGLDSVGLLQKHNGKEFI